MSSLVTFTGVQHYLENSPGEGYVFEYRDAIYVVECWATRSTSGQDIYTAAGGMVSDLFDSDEDSERFEAELQAFKDAWQKGYETFVREAFEKAEKHAVDAFAVWAEAYGADALKWGDSNDGEIDALKGALESALTLLGMSMPSTEEPEDEND